MMSSNAAGRGTRIGLTLATFGLGLTLAAFGVGRWTAPRSVPIRAAPAENHDERLALLERQMEALRAERLIARRLQVSAPVGGEREVSEEPEKEPGAGDTKEAQGDEEGERQRVRDEEQNFLTELDARVHTEPLDARWRSETEPVIETVVATRLGREVQVESMLCASTLCQVHLSHPTFVRIPDLKFIDFALHREALSAMELHTDLREPGKTTLYLHRPKQPAPTESL